MPSPVDCAFVRHAIGRDPEVATHPVFPPTGSRGLQMRVCDTALREACARGAQQFATPNLLAGNGSWFVYRVNSDMMTSELVANPPSKGAAEMWMIHRGE